ncbi:MAG: hypothetical protein FWE31_01730 [Firmicutes bacterium]|nr:hypothetical protein [Bacillota bacterium]
MEDKVLALLRHHGPGALREAFNSLGADIAKSDKFMNFQGTKEPAVEEIQQILAQSPGISINDLLDKAIEMYPQVKSSSKILPSDKIIEEVEAGIL